MSVSTAFVFLSSERGRLIGCHFWASVRIVSSVFISSPSNLLDDIDQGLQKAL